MKITFEWINTDIDCPFCGDKLIEKYRNIPNLVTSLCCRSCSWMVSKEEYEKWRIGGIIMPEKKDLIKIKMVTDDDTGMYRIGETEACITHGELRGYIKSFGHGNLLETLNYLIADIINVSREINSEAQQAQTEKSK